MFAFPWTLYPCCYPFANPFKDLLKSAIKYVYKMSSGLALKKKHKNNVLYSVDHWAR